MTLREYMKKSPLFLDGGTGTLLQKEGLKAGELPELWNLSHPEVIRRIAKDYYDAGSNLVCTDTFGANGLKFDGETLENVIRAAVENVKIARDESVGTQEKFIALDMGPLGRLLKPMGDLDFEDAVRIFAQTVKIGVSCGVDALLIETMTDGYETKAALLAAKENCDLPVFVSNAYGADGRLLNGATPEAMVALLEGMGADAVGANCSLGPEQLMPVIRRLLKAACVPVLFKPNAGLPREEAGKTVFDVSPEDFASSVFAAMEEGVRIAGGCCGTTPEYIRALTARAAGFQPLPIPKKRHSLIASYTHTVDLSAGPVLIGERINPTGKKRFQQALREKDFAYLLHEGIAQQEKGAQVLDVNVGLPDVDEKSMLTEAVCRLQTVTDLPLQIDTANLAAMESALRRYNGKALINSVNGKEESMRAIFPLQKKYGGVAVALTLDESGIPDTVEGRIRIAEKILSVAAEYGIGKEDLLFDPLAMAVSADQKAASVTLEAVRRLTEMGCMTSLGVSNVSFGLPAREGVNALFFTMALERGLRAAILNPHCTELMKAYYTFRLLQGMDENCADYVAFCSELPQPVSASAAPAPKKTLAEGSELKQAIEKGLKEKAAVLGAEYLKNTDPLAVISEHIVPALDAVGKAYEEKIAFLPQLLMAAEAAKAVFDEIKKAFPPKDGDEGKGPVVLATVKGDVHDIGKNILRLLLENYGFSVVDLGKDVSPEDILQTVLDRKAPLAGLSALMTTTVPAMEETVTLLHEKAPFCKVMVGGAVLTQEYADRIGADFYGKDALSAVRHAERVIG